MTDEKKKVPELRFPEFSGEWEEKKWGEVITKKSKKYSPNLNENYVDIELDSVESNTGRVIQKYDSKLFNSQKNKFNKDQVLYSKLRPYLNKYVYTVYDGVCSSEFWVLSSKNYSKLLNMYIYLIVQSNRFAKYANISSGSKMPRADWKIVSKQKIFLPQLEEQRKIGDFFNKLDRQIELEEQKLEKLEELKKGYMQKIFSQELRFKDENGNDYPEWEEKRLSQLVKYQSSKRSSQNYSHSTIKGEFPVYDAVEEINRDISFDIESSYISILKDGAGVGRLNLRPGKSSVIGTMGYILPQDIDINYLFYRLKTINFKKYIIGSTIPHLYFKDFSKEIILTPKDKNEQFRIGSFFHMMDKINERINNKIKMLNELKKGCLQKLFI